MQVRLSISGPRDVVDMDHVREVLVETVDAAQTVILQIMGPEIPVFTGHLRASWQSTRPEVDGATVKGSVGTPLLYGAVMNDGRTPGAQMPPPEALEAWVRLKMGADVSAYVVARSIGRKGIKGRHYVEKALAAAEPVLAALSDRAAARMVEG